MGLPLGAALSLPLVLWVYAGWNLARGFQLRDVIIHASWHNERVTDAIKRAQDGTTIRIMQTWLPEREHLFPLIADEMTRSGKDLTLEVLLMHPGTSDPDADDLLAARVRHRDERRAQARAHIIDTIDHLFRMRDRLEKVSGKRGRLDLAVRCHHTLPFGPIYQVGDERMFVGLYLPTRSSLNAPMIEIRRKESGYWYTFEQAFLAVWHDADTVEDVKFGDLVLYDAR
jgi:hypothetical protein